MSRRDSAQTSDMRDETLTNEGGVTLSRAGVERAGEQPSESRARHTAEYFAALRDRLSISPPTA